MDSYSSFGDCGTTSSGDCGTTSAADGGTTSGGDHGTTSGDCGAESRNGHSTERDFAYTDFAAGPQPAAIGSSNPSGPPAQPDTRSPEDIRAQKQQSEARAQKKKERKEKARKLFNSVKAVAENIVKGKF